MKVKLRQFMSGSREDQPFAEIAPAVSISKNNWRIYFNAATVEILGLSASDSLSIYENEYNGKDWYLAKAVRGSEGAYPLKQEDRCQKPLVVHKGCSPARMILKRVNGGRSCRFLLTPTTVEGKGVWRICTETPLKSARQ